MYFVYILYICILCSHFYSKNGHSVWKLFLQGEIEWPFGTKTPLDRDYIFEYSISVINFIFNNYLLIQKHTVLVYEQMPIGLNYIKQGTKNGAKIF